MARRFDHGGRVPLEDLKQVAAIGLIKAIDRFDPSRGVPFSSYAVPTMQGELRRYFRDFTWAVRPPRDLQERAIRVMRERDSLTSTLGRSPTPVELAERMGVTAEEVVEASTAACARTSDSLDRPASVGDDDGDSLGERIGIEDSGYRAAEAAATLDHLLARLSDRERLALYLRFHEDLTQAEIGKRIGCSQMHVSRILRTAISQLAEQPPVTP
jgi:RNA polymerase sigma-B factor